MAVNMNWLEGIRSNNRARFGMSGLGQQMLREKRTGEVESLASQVRTQEERQRTPRAAPSGNGQPSAFLPPLSLPAFPSIPRSVLIGGAIFGAAVLGLLVYSVVKRPAKPAKKEV